MNYNRMLYLRSLKIILSDNFDYRRGLLHYGLVIFLLVFLFRGLFNYIDTFYDGDYLTRHDFTSKMINYGHKLDPDFYLCYVLVAVFFVYSEHFLYLQFAWRGASVCPLIYDLSVRNTIDVIESNWPLFTAPALVNWKSEPLQALRYLSQLVRYLFNQTNAPQEFRVKFQQNLDWFPLLSKKHRARMFLVNMACELMVTLWPIFISLFVYTTAIIVSWDGLLSVFRYALSGLGWPLYVLELTIHLIPFVTDPFFVWLIMFNSLTLVSMDLTILYTLTVQYIQLNRLWHWEPNSGKQESRFMFASRVQLVTKEHARLSWYVLMGSDVWSLFVGIIIATNLPIQIYAVATFYYKQLPAMQTVLILFLVLTQFVFLLTAMLPLANINRLVHASRDGHIGKQAQLRRSVWLKWKVLEHYEMVNTDKDIGYRVGVYGIVTYTALFETSLVYVAYLLFFAKIINGVD